MHPAKRVHQYLKISVFPLQLDNENFKAESSSRRFRFSLDSNKLYKIKESLNMYQYSTKLTLRHSSTHVGRLKMSVYCYSVPTVLQKTSVKLSFSYLYSRLQR